MRPIAARHLSVLAVSTALLVAACDASPTVPTGGAPAPLAAKSKPTQPTNPSHTKEKAGALPERFVIPGPTVFPEGIAFDHRTQSVFVSSTGDGTIFRGHVGDATLSPFLAPGGDGRTTAIGLEVDDAGHLFVAGGATGFVWVYDIGTGALVARLAGGSSPPTFINDIAVGRDGVAYATDSQSPILYRIVPVAGGGYTLERWLPLTGTPIVYETGFNVNGIEIAPNGRHLFVIQSNTGRLFRIEIDTKAIVPVDLGGEVLQNGDGVWLRGNTLYVLQNQQGIIAEVRLNPNQARGEVVSRTTDPSFVVPTSLVGARGRLLVVNSQFNRRGPGLTPVLPFTVSVVDIP